MKRYAFTPLYVNLYTRGQLSWRLLARTLLVIHRLLSEPYSVHRTTRVVRGARIEVVFGEEPRDTHQELVEDLVEIITSFTGKLYGIRSRRKKKLVEEFREP